MAIVVNVDVMLARRKMRLNELAERVGRPFDLVARLVAAFGLPQPHPADRVRADEAAIRETVGGEAPDDTPQALDRAWEEAPVTFRDDPAATADCSAASAMVARFAPRRPGTTAHRSGTR